MKPAPTVAATLKGLRERIDRIGRVIDPTLERRNGR
jgi:hypothetical protein